MKRLLFTFLIMLAFSIGIRAQANNGVPQTNVSHLRFQGIPITGSMKSFGQKLLQKGLMGGYSYQLAFYYTDEYNKPEWKDARKQYLKERKAKLAL